MSSSIFIPSDHVITGFLNTSAGNNVNNLNVVSKSSPSTAKNTPKDQKIFSAAKPIDPAWLAQTKMETANMVNANKLLVRHFKKCVSSIIRYNNLFNFI